MSTNIYKRQRMCEGRYHIIGIASFWAIVTCANAVSNLANVSWALPTAALTFLTAASCWIFALCNAIGSSLLSTYQQFGLGPVLQHDAAAWVHEATFQVVPPLALRISPEASVCQGWYRTSCEPCPGMLLLQQHAWQPLRRRAPVRGPWPRTPRRHFVRAR